MGYMNNDGLLYFWTKLKTIFVRTVNGNGPDPNGNVSVPVPSASSTSPKMDGTATVGSETAYARGDHVHPKDTSKANLASPTFTGTPAAPTAAAGTNTTQIATTAFVQTALSKAVHGNGRVFHGTTATAAGTTAKVVTCADFASTDLVYGTILVLEFDNANTATLPTLNVNSTGAKEAYWYWGGSEVGFGKMASKANHPYIFVYDGTKWLTDYVSIASSTTPKMDGTAAYGSEVGFARGDHVHPTDTSRAPLASPAFTGTPAAPTAAAGTNTTQIATTEFVQTAVSGASVSPATNNPKMDGTVSVGVSAKYAREDHVHPTDTSRAPLASPALTGTPTAPTPTSTSGDTQIATKKYVDDKIVSIVVPLPSDSNPKMDGTAAPGTSSAYSRYDHVHPKDTSKANLASPTFTGTPKAPTAEAGTNNTQIATTAFVKTAVDSAVASAISGVASFKGAATAQSTIDGTANIQTGWYWVVQTAGTYYGQDCESGDFIYVTATTPIRKPGDTTKWDDSNFSIIQTNITPMTNSEIDTIVAS